MLGYLCIVSWLEVKWFLCSTNSQYSACKIKHAFQLRKIGYIWAETRFCLLRTNGSVERMCNRLSISRFFFEFNFERTIESHNEFTFCTAYLFIYSFVLIFYFLFIERRNHGIEWSRFVKLTAAIALFRFITVFVSIYFILFQKL